EEACMMRHQCRRASAGVIAAVLAVLVTATSAQAREQITAVLHVHSDLTTGDLPLEEVARVAEANGIGAILLAENYLLRVEYGLPAVRAVAAGEGEGAGGPRRRRQEAVSRAGGGRAPPAPPPAHRARRRGDAALLLDGLTRQPLADAPQRAEES